MVTMATGIKIDEKNGYPDHSFAYSSITIGLIDKSNIPTCSGDMWASYFSSTDYHLLGNHGYHGNQKGVQKIDEFLGPFRLVSCQHVKTFAWFCLYYWKSGMASKSCCY